jgi:hypothetical protein
MVKNFNHVVKQLSIGRMRGGKIIVFDKERKVLEMSHKGHRIKHIMLSSNAKLILF